MKRIKISTLVLATILICSCKKNEPVVVPQQPILGPTAADLLDDCSPDELIFGQYYGECFGDYCIVNYRLESPSWCNDSTFFLYKDTSKTYPSVVDYIEGKYVQQSKEKLQLAKDLLTLFPSKLMDDTTKVFGCPDCADGGGLYIERSVNRIRRKWLIDKNTSNLPIEYKEFVDSVNAKLQKLRN